MRGRTYHSHRLEKEVGFPERVRDSGRMERVRIGEGVGTRRSDLDKEGKEGFPHKGQELIPLRPIKTEKLMTQDNGRLLKFIFFIRVLI